MVALMSSVIYSIAKKNSQKTFKLNFDVIKYAVAVGVSLALYLKDKFTRKQIVGIILGFIALILMNY